MDDVASGSALLSRSAWGRELSDLTRAAAGALLIGVPLVYTMEMWWTGTRTAPGHNLVVLGSALVIVTALQRTSGFRRSRDTCWRDAAMDAVEVVALSLVLALLLLVLLRQITDTTPVNVAVGNVVHQALGFSIGAGVANQYLSESRDETGDEEDEDDEGGESGGTESDAAGRLNATVADLGATMIGAVFIALNIAPTDEVPMLVTALDPAWLVGLVVVSLVLSYGVVFTAGFSGQRQRRAQQGVFQHPITETFVCYLLSLACAVVMLIAFDTLGDSWSVRLSTVIVLGMPAAVGGAAGRLAI